MNGSVAAAYSYRECLENSKKVSWSEEDVFADKNFDFSKRFLPNRLSGVDEITCLSEDEKRRLNQIMGNAYCHIFAFVEEFIIPMVMQEASKNTYGDEIRLRALLRFAEEELKHQEMFRRSMELFDRGFGSPCGLLPGREEVARAVLSKSTLAALYLTTVIEWFTQLHYVEHVRDDSGLDPLFRDLLKFHWLEEAQHAKLDTLLIAEVAAQATPEERERAVDELLELGAAVDTLLFEQIGLNIETLERAAGRSFTAAEKEEITQKTRHAWRWTFLVSGLEHPNFVRVLNALTTEGPGKVEAAVKGLSA